MWAERVAADLQAAFGEALEARIITADAPITLAIEPSWDDLLLILYGDAPFPAEGCDYLRRYQGKTAGAGFVLPVALDPQHRQPPAPYGGLKAMVWDEQASGAEGTIARRAGALLGLRLRGRKSRIFLSYRAKDGTAVAEQLEGFLTSHGFCPWRDESRDREDGEPNLLPGEDVQEVIDSHIEAASLVLLVDTPAARESKWIRIEIDSALAAHVPVLPVCCRSAGDRHRGSRFRSLQALQRFVEVGLRPERQQDPLEPAELDYILAEVDDYVGTIYRRRLRVPFLARREFTARQWGWEELDVRRLLFRASREWAQRRLRSEVLSHCSIHDEVFPPALRRFLETVREEPSGRNSNYRLFIYDGEVLPETDLVELYREERLDEIANVLVVHHQELAPLLDSNFTRVT